MVGKKIQDKNLVIIAFFTAILSISCNPVEEEILLPDLEEEIIDPTWLNVLDFGAVDDMNTYSTYEIQAAVDSAYKQGGGTVYLPKGAYLTAPIHLKSNVTIHLAAEAVIYGSTEILKYSMLAEGALIYAKNQKNIAIEGKGTIDGRGKALAMDVINKIAIGGVINESQATTDEIRKALNNGHDFYANPFPRPAVANRPKLICFDKCTGVRLENTTFKHASSWTISLYNSNDITVQGIKLISTAYWNNDGLDLTDCKDVVVKNSNFDSADDGICLKSETTRGCENILIDSCRVRSSANAVKFGTASRGGFRNITITNITVYNTYRSAIALEAVDGGGLENIHISNINATKTGNALFLVVGTRTNGNQSYMKNVVIENLKCEVPATKPDEGYPIAGPKLNYKHNIFPSTITGHKDSQIEDVTLRNIEIIFAGGGLASIAFCDVAMLNAQMDEKYANYPEFSMFRELPAWGILTRYVNNIEMENVRLILKTEDYRNAFVFDKCDDVKLKDISVLKDTKTPLIFNKTTNKEISEVSAPENRSGKLYEDYNY